MGMPPRNDRATVPRIVMPNPASGLRTETMVPPGPSRRSADHFNVPASLVRTDNQHPPVTHALTKTQRWGHASSRRVVLRSHETSTSGLRMAKPSAPRLGEGDKYPVSKIIWMPRSVTPIRRIAAHDATVYKSALSGGIGFARGLGWLYPVRAST